MAMPKSQGSDPLSGESKPTWFGKGGRCIVYSGWQSLTYRREKKVWEEDLPNEMAPIVEEEVKSFGEELVAVSVMVERWGMAKMMDLDLVVQMAILDVEASSP